MNAQEINERIRKSKQEKITTYPCNNLRASNLGHPCERYLYLLLTRWEEQEAHDVGLQNIFDLGNELEPVTFKTLKEAGYEIITPTQRSWRIDTPLITGREDCRIKDEDGQLYPVEVKWMSPFEYDKLNTIQDFFNSKRHYVRAYPAQLMCYMWKFEKLKGYFALGNKLTGEIKLIDIEFDYEYTDQLFKKADRIYKAKADKIAPEPIEDSSVCERCSLRHACGCSIRVPTDVEMDGELEELIDKKEELRELKKQFDDLDEQIKSKVGERTKVLAGKYFIERKSSTKAACIKEIPETTTWRTYIKKVGE